MFSGFAASSELLSAPPTSVVKMKRIDAASTTTTPGNTPHTKRNSPLQCNTECNPSLAATWHTRLQGTVEECIVVDLETTGLDPRTDRIIEIAAIHVRNGQPIQRFHSLVNPQQSIPVFITDLTGISDGLLNDAPTFSAVSQSLYEFLTAPRNHGDATVLPLVGHNVGFDFSFLQHEFLRITLSDPTDTAFTPYTPPLVCTAEASRVLINRQAVGRYRLEKVAAALGTPNRPRHRAEADARATADVLIALAKLGMDA